MKQDRLDQVPEWLDDSRREPRWVDVRFALARVGHAEYPAMTGDVSLGGMRLALVGAEPRTGDEIEADVAFEREVIEVQGRVAYVLQKPWGCLLGVHCREEYKLARGSLSHRNDSSSKSSTIETSPQIEM